MLSSCRKTSGNTSCKSPGWQSSGAIGAAMETLRVVKRRGYSTFLGLEAAIYLSYVSRNDESTRCGFCPNHCSRTFIDSKTPDGQTARYISGFSCEKGTVEDEKAVVELNKRRQDLKKHYPNLVEYEARRMFQHIYDPDPMPGNDQFVRDTQVRRGLLGLRKTSSLRSFERSPKEAAERRGRIRIGIPKVLNIWSTAPFWRTYFETLGIDPKNIVFSDNAMTEDESDFAADQGWKALDLFDAEMQEKGRQILEQVEQENRLAILLIGRPYHSDPGLNHGVLEEFQVLGYPVLSMRSIPKDEGWLQRFFREDLQSGRVEYELEVSDVWPENFSANSVQKVWAAKFAARHPNVAVLDLSSFKCGHDAPTYGLIDSIISAAGTPYSALHDIDANKPSGSIKIRVKMYAHSLGLHEERLQDLADSKAELQRLLEQKRDELLKKTI